jgi:hypothetical protein
MKALLVSLLTLFYFSTQAGTPYRSYLLSQIYIVQTKTKQPETCLSSTQITFTIPRYETPKGNVFCRLEDKLIRATKVWIKLGVK